MQETKIEVVLENSGFWHIDKESGKWMCVVRISGNGTLLANVPPHNWCVEYLDKMLDAEWRNDHHIFEKGVYGEKSNRPPQLPEKIGMIERVLAKWRKRMLEE